ncbi:hypothetical protein Tco_0975905 [Tanacetum coccineum]|uniref:Uncharacterized protein n=1 Tax=Tanacetum coccineum TaxID=301880 RepID=A0ABQ5EG16_9ASTR
MIAKQAELNNRMSKGSGQREIRPVWNNVQRVNHQNQFVPKAVLTRTSKIQVNTTRTSGTNTVNTARHNFNRQAVPTNAARKVNTVKPIVKNARPKVGFHKTLSPFRKPFNRTTSLRTTFSYQKVNTAEVNVVSAVGGKRETAVKPSTEQRDAYEKKLIQVLKIHTDDNVADLLTKAFDVNRESLERDIDGTEELLFPDLFILWLTKVSTDSAKLIPLGKDSTAIKTLEKIPPRV